MEVKATQRRPVICGVTLQPYGLWPYRLCWVLLALALCNIGISSHWLFGAVVSQVLMVPLFLCNAKLLAEMPTLWVTAGPFSLFGSGARLVASLPDIHTCLVAFHERFPCCSQANLVFVEDAKATRNGLAAADAVRVAATWQSS